VLSSVCLGGFTTVSTQEIERGALRFLLTCWRLRLGVQMLVSTSYSVAQIASEVGYESEAAFNRAFKREFENPPARFRSQSRSIHTKQPRQDKSKS
jgi:transcriptional regulator GlxA family with amidase domain